jgi:hypothetical protein
VLLDASQDLGTVDLADDDVLAAHPGDRVVHPPAVAVELREGVQVHVAVAHADVPAERGRVEPDVAVRQLHPLGPRRRPRRVVDGGRGVLVGVPWPRLHPVAHQRGVGLGADHELALALDGLHGVLELGVDEQDAGPGVLDDVADLVGHQTEVDRHEDPPGTGHAVQGRQQPGRVVAEHRDPLADADAELVEPGGDRPGPPGHLAVVDRAP